MPFNKEMLDSFYADLQSKYKKDPDWDRILKDAHLGIARSDAGVALGNIDKRAIEVIEKHRK
jgi:hypothetical protein